MSDSNEVSKLATDLDKAPSGEVIIERLLTAQIKLQRENAAMAADNTALKARVTTLEAQVQKLADQMLVLTNLVDSDHAAILVLLGERHQSQTGGIVN